MRFNPINLFGLAIVAVMLIPNIAYAVRRRSGTEQSGGGRKLLCWFEQVGRYGSMILMAVPVMVGEFGFAGVTAFLIYAVGNTVLLLAYLVAWGLYFKKVCRGKELVLAVLPTCIFLLSGITLRHWLLVATAILFGVGHIYTVLRSAD